MDMSIESSNIFEKIDVNKKGPTRRFDPYKPVERQVGLRHLHVGRLPVVASTLLLGPIAALKGEDLASRWVTS